MLRVSVSNPLEVAAPAPRAALLWTYSDGSKLRFVTTADAAIDSSAPTLALPLRMPPRKIIPKLVPLDHTEIGGKTVEIYRPRVIAYEDKNGSGKLELDTLGIDLPDRVLAADTEALTVAAILDLDALLRELPVEEVALYYRASGGRYSPFVMVEYPGNELRSQWGAALGLVLDGSGFPSDSIACLRPPLPSGESAVSTTVTLDVGIDPSTCGPYVFGCTTTPFGLMDPPKFSEYQSPTLFRGAVCQSVPPLQSLLIGTTEIACDECACSNSYEVHAYVANQNALPTWWPCGDQVDLCTSSVELFEFPANCAK